MTGYQPLNCFLSKGFFINTTKMKMVKRRVEKGRSGYRNETKVHDVGIGLVNDEGNLRQ